MPSTTKPKAPGAGAPAADDAAKLKKRMRPSGATAYEENRAFAAAREYLKKRGLGPRDLLD